MNLGSSSGENTGLAKRQRSKYRQFISWLSTYMKKRGFTPPIWPLVILSLLVLDVSLQQPSLLIMGGLMALVCVVSDQINKLLPQIKSSKKIPFAWVSWRVLALGVIGAFFLLNELSVPASAQFLLGAQSFFEESFPQAGEAIPLTFNVIRGIYLIYLAVALVGVINQVRQEDDWKTAARTPALIVFVVTVADVLAALITG